ncbi:hypothetical protein ATCC90586_002599 [Pythium insidiosum]|nr:hypothetical protein ATCC90586_002599 [Pythium insidiosum]
MVWAVPNADAVTLGELNGELYSVTPRDELHLGAEFVRRGGTVFSPARVTGLKQRRPFGQQESLTEESDADAMEPHALRLAKQLVRALRLFFVADERHVARELVASAKWLVEHVPFVRPVGDDREDASAFVDAKARRAFMEETIATMAWHPTLSILAVAQRDGVVALFDVSTGRWDTRVLEHADQQDITSIQWARLSGSMLAVAARDTVFLWNVSCEKAGKEPELVEVIKHPSAKTISQLCWNEDGSLLAVLGAQSDAVLVIDVTYNRHTELLCHDRCLLLAPRNKALIYPYEMRAKPPSMDVAINAPAIEFAEKQIHSLDRSTFEYVGGKVVSMTWDSSNTRVAVTYAPSTSADGCGDFGDPDLEFLCGDCHADKIEIEKQQALLEYIETKKGSKKAFTESGIGAVITSLVAPESPTRRGPPSIDHRRALEEFLTRPREKEPGVVNRDPDETLRVLASADYQ